MTTVGFVGLGLMGSAMTQNLLEAGFAVRGYDVDPARRAELEERGGVSVSTPAETATDAEVVLLSLPDGGVVSQVCLGEDGLAGAARPGLIVVDTSTARPSDSIRTAEELVAAQVRFLDASVSGTSRMAAERNLVAMVGGPADAYEEAAAVIDAIARSRYHLGPVGSGTKTKLIVNLALGVSRLMLAESLVLGERAGMDLEMLLEVLKDSVAYSRVMDVYGERMIAGDHANPTGRISTQTKDIGLILEFAHEEGVPLWLTPVLDQILDVARLSGMWDWDSTATVEVLRRFTDDEIRPSEPPPGA